MNDQQTLEQKLSGAAPNDSSNGQQFEGRWRVLANSMVERTPGDDKFREEVAVIKRDTQSRGAIYKLYCEATTNGIVECEFLQTLEYHPATNMLGHLRGQRERCLAFWDLGHSRCIFGMRRKTVGTPEVGLYPWEKVDDDGTWGAELEPPIEEAG